MKFVNKIIFLLICFVFLNGFWKDFAIGFFDEANKVYEEKRKVKNAWKQKGFNQKESDDFFQKLEAFGNCKKENIENNLFLKLGFHNKSPKIKTYKNFSDSSFANQTEKELISDYGSELDKCFNYIRSSNYKSALILELSMIPQRRYIQTLFALAELENNEITWGQFNRKIQAITDNTRLKSETFLKKIDDTAMQVYNTVKLQEEAEAIERNRNYLKQELQISKNQMRELEFEIRELEKQKRTLRLCAMNPGEYIGCPDVN